MFLAYETLRIVWWLVLGVTLVGFAIVNGFGLGVAILLPFVARDNIERITARRTVNLGLGRQSGMVPSCRRRYFRAVAPLHVIAFSGFFFAMFAVLMALIARPVATRLRR